MEGGLINPLALIRTGAAEGVTSAAIKPHRWAALAASALACACFA
jgi:hypothetical protein